MQTAVTAKKLWDGSRLIDEPAIMIEDGQIASIASRPNSEIGAELAGRAADVFDFPGATLAPAFLDVHFHGAAGHDVMEATPEALAAIGSLLAARGTGSFLATTVTAPLDATLRAVAGLAKLIREPSLVDERSANGNPWRGLSAFISRDRFSLTRNAAFNPPSICWRRTWLSLTGSSRLLKARCG